MKSKDLERYLYIILTALFTHDHALVIGFSQKTVVRYLIFNSVTLFNIKILYCTLFIHVLWMFINCQYFLYFSSTHHQMMVFPLMHIFSKIG